jgi:hypothetical protein
MRLVDVLLAAKEKYPDRVFLLLGNRDVNKVRFIRELAPPLESIPLDNIPPAVESKQYPSVRSFLLNLARTQVLDFLPHSYFLNCIYPLACAVNSSDRA